MLLMKYQENHLSTFKQHLCMILADSTLVLGICFASETFGFWHIIYLCLNPCVYVCVCIAWLIDALYEQPKWF